MRTHLAAILFLSVPLAACGGKSAPKPAPVDDSEKVTEETSPDPEEGGDWEEEEEEEEVEPYVPATLQPPAMVGTWRVGCAPGMAAKQWQSALFVVQVDRWDLTFDMFGDEACTKATQSLHFGGAYTVGAQSATVAEAWDVDFLFDTRGITAHDKASVKAIGKACGLKKLKAGTKTEIHKTGCPKLGIKPADACGGDFDLVKQVGSRLHFGVRPADNDLCTADKRPTEIETAFAADYQWPATGVAACDAMFVTLDRYLGCEDFSLAMRNEVFFAVRTNIADESSTWAAAPAATQEALGDGCKVMGDNYLMNAQALGCP